MCVGYVIKRKGVYLVSRRKSGEKRSELVNIVGWKKVLYGVA